MKYVVIVANRVFSIRSECYLDLERIFKFVAWIGTKIVMAADRFN